MGFNFPHPPSYLVFPQTAQNIADLVMLVLVVAFVAFGAYELRARRGPLCLVLLAGGAISYLNEPMLDVLGLLWHPRPGQRVAIDTFGPVPLWGLGIYTVFFGGGTYLLIRAIELGLPRRRLWLGIAAFCLVDMAVEIPLIGAGLYRYYGFHTPPLEIGGMPMFWLFMNAGAPLLGACAMLAAPEAFRGWRQARAVLVPLVAFACFSVGTGLPVFTAEHMRTLPVWLLWAAGLLTMAIGASVIHELAGWAERRGRVVTGLRASIGSEPTSDQRPRSAAARTTATAEAAAGGGNAGRDPDAARAALGPRA